MDFKSTVSNVNGVPSTDQGMPHRTAKGNPSDGKKQQGASSSDSINSGLVVGANSAMSPAVARSVDAKDVSVDFGWKAGSHPGDTRVSGDSVKATMDQIANPPSPREQMRGQQNSRSYNENGKAFTSTETPDVGD